MSLTHRLTSKLRPRRIKFRNVNAESWVATQSNEGRVGRGPSVRAPGPSKSPRDPSISGSGSSWYLSDIHPGPTPLHRALHSTHPGDPPRLGNLLGSVLGPPRPSPPARPERGVHHSPGERKPLPPFRSSRVVLPDLGVLPDHLSWRSLVFDVRIFDSSGAYRFPNRTGFGGGR